LFYSVYRVWLLTAALFFLPAPPCSEAAASTAAEKYTGKGFSFSLPASYIPGGPPDGGTFLSFSSPYSNVKVFAQELSKRVRAETYIEYGNRQLYLGKAGFSLRQKRNTTVNGYRITALAYSRPPIVSLDNDRNYYREVHIAGNRHNRVVTFWAKAAQEHCFSLEKDLDLAVRSFREIPEEPPAGQTPAQTLVISPQVRYTGKKVTLEIPPGEIVWGRFCPGVPFDAGSYDRMQDSEVRLGHKFEFLMTYCRFPDNKPFPAEAVQNVYRDGRVLMLTLQPFDGRTDWVAVPEIIAGKHDAAIKEWAEGLKKIGEPVFVRPLNEMNGDWDPWCAWYYGKDTDLYILAWRHIVDLFRETGTTNALFVWNPHDRSYPDFEWNNPHRYYPGDAYVDWIGLTGYNNGTSHPADTWREFDDIYRPLYDDYLRHYPNKPFMITEFSCNEAGGDKARWIERCMVSLARNYPNIKIATWFDSRDNAWLYQLDSSPEAFAAFQQGLRDGNWLKRAVFSAP